MRIDHILCVHSSCGGHWVVSTFWGLTNKAAISFMYKFLSGHILAFLLDKMPRTESAGPVAVSVSPSEAVPDGFPPQLYHCTLPPSRYEGAHVSTSSPALTQVPLVLAILVGVEWVWLAIGILLAWSYIAPCQHFQCTIQHSR